jgi:CHASE3 domain sensor protein
MDHQSPPSAHKEDRAPWLEQQTLRVLGALLPRSVRHRQIHEWQDQLDCTRATNGNPRRELIELVRSAAPITWLAMPWALRISLPPLVTAMIAALLLWPATPGSNAARIDLAQSVERSLLSIDWALNRYVTTRERRYLHSAQRDLAAHPEQLRRLTALSDDPDQQREAHALSEAIRDYDQFWALTLIEIMNDGDVREAREQVETDGGRERLNRLRAQLRLSTAAGSNAARKGLIRRLETSLLSIDTALNRSITASDPGYLRSAQRDLAAHPEQLRRLTALSDNLEQQREARALSEAIRDYHQFWVVPMMDIINEGDFTEARNQLNTDGGRQRLDRLRAQLKSMLELRP